HPAGGVLKALRQPARAPHSRPSSGLGPRSARPPMNKVDPQNGHDRSNPSHLDLGRSSSSMPFQVFDSRPGFEGPRERPSTEGSKTAGDRRKLPMGPWSRRVAHEINFHPIA